MKKNLVPLSKFEDEIGSSMIRNLLEFWLIHEQGFALFLSDTSFTLEWFLNLGICISMYVNCESQTVKPKKWQLCSISFCPICTRNDNYAANLFARFIFVRYQDFGKNDAWSYRNFPILNRKFLKFVLTNLDLVCSYFLDIGLQNGYRLLGI